MRSHKDLKDIIIYMAPLAVSVIFPLIALPIYTKELSIDGYGLLALSLAFSVFANGIVNFGTSLAFERNFFEYSSDNSKLSQLFFSVLLFLIANFLIILVPTFLFKEEISYFFTGSYEHGNIFLNAFIAQFFFLNLTKNYYTYFRNIYRSDIYSKYMILGSLINFIISILLVAYFKIGVLGIIYAQFISGLIVFILMSHLVMRDLVFSFRYTILINTLKISYPLTPRIFIGVINNQFNVYMIGLLANIGFAGIYDLAQKFSNLIFSLITALENVFNPKIYEEMFQTENMQSIEIGKYITPFFYYSIFLSVGVVYSVEEFILFFIPQEFHSAIYVIYNLAVYPCILFFGKINSMQFLYAKKTFTISLISILSLSFNIIINIPLISEYGVTGAALGTLISSISILIISFNLAQKCFYIEWEHKKIIVLALGFLACLGGIYFIKEIFDSPAIVILFKISFIGALIVLGIIMKILNKSTIDSLIAITSRKSP